jgi:hypothetical protein
MGGAKGLVLVPDVIDGAVTVFETEENHVAFGVEAHGGDGGQRLRLCGVLVWTKTEAER